MKKILLTLTLLIPSLLAGARGPVKAWNDQLDSFIDLFNAMDSALEELDSRNGINNSFTFTYFEPKNTNANSRQSLTDEGSVIKEITLFDNNDFNNVSDQLLTDVKALALSQLTGEAANSKTNGIFSEFAKRGVNIVIMYSTEKDGKKLTKQIVITPAELQASK